MRIEISKIKWDTDGASPKKLKLPNKVKMQIRKELLDDPYCEEINNKLSDKYGYCTFGFKTKII